MIDDDPDMTRILEDILVVHNYDVIVAHDGMEAIERTNQERMPLLSGFWFANVFSKRPQTKGVPVVVMSALAGEEEVKKAYQLGARAYLKKPFRSEELLELVQKAVA